MFGAIDLKSGSGSLTGVNLFQVDKNPLDVLYEGLDSVIGDQGAALGGGIGSFFNFTIQLVQGLIDAILGLPNDFLSEFAPLLGLLEGGLLDSVRSLGTFFDNLLGFLGGLDPLSDLFSIATAAENFINGVLAETGLLPILNEAGHLAATVLQPFIDAISQGLGGLAGLDFGELESQIATAITDLLSVSTWAEFLADANTALGTAGSDLAHLISGLMAIPTGNVLGLQGLVDFVNSVLSMLGLSGINSTIGGVVGDLLTPLQNLLGVDSPDVITAITGTAWFTDLQSALGLTGAGLGTGGLSYPSLSGIPLLGDLLSITDTGVVDALTGTPWFGDLQSLLGDPAGLGTGSFSLPGIGSIPLLDGVAAIDTLVQAWGGTSTGYIQSDLFIAAQNISNTFVTGVLTSPDIGTAIQQTVNAGAVAIGAVTSGIDATLAQWQSQLANIVNTFLGYNTTGAAPPTTSVAGVATAAHNTITSRAVQNNLFEAQDPTANSVFPMSDIEGLTTQATINVSEGTTVAGYITTRDGGIKEAIGWLGYGGTNITSAVFNIYSVNTATGTWTWVYQTPDFHAALGGSVPAWNFYNLPSTAYLSTTPGQMWVAEMRVTGTGTHQVVGKQANLPTYPSVSIFPSAKGAHRNDLYLSDSAHPRVVSTGAGIAVQAQATSYTHTVVSGTNNWYAGIFQFNTSGTLNTANVTVKLGTRTATLINVVTFATGSVLMLYEIIGSVASPLPTGAQTVTVTETGSLGTVFITANSVEITGVVNRSSPTGSSGTGTSVATASWTTDPSTLTLMLLGNATQAMTPGANTQVLYNQGPSATTLSTVIMVGSGGTNSTYAASAASSTWGTIEVSLIPAANHPPSVGNPTPSVAPASYSTDTPFFLLTGNPGATELVFNPLFIPFNAGSHSYTPPLWANYIDVVIMAAGGGGAGGDSVNFLGGGGGSNGPTSPFTLTKAQWTAGSPWTMAVGAGGAPGVGGAGGSSGTTTVVGIPGYGNVVTPGGAGGAFDGGSAGGGGSGGTQPDVSWPDAHGNGNVYGGGGGGPGGPLFALGADGATPGGGGGGGGADYPGHTAPGGGWGGDAVVYLLIYQ